MGAHFQKEPIFHSYVEDESRKGTPLIGPLKKVDELNGNVLCDKCKGLCVCQEEVVNNWFETEIGNFCTSCFDVINFGGSVDSALGENYKISKEGLRITQENYERRISNAT